MSALKVVMIDQDGVVVDHSYRTTVDTTAIIALCRERSDVMLVPNSDTPAERLRRNFEVLLGFRPTMVIAEGGAVVSVDGATLHSVDIRGIVEYRAALATRFRDRDAVVAVGDSATWIREGRRFVPRRRLLIVDGLREQTVGFYLKVTDDDGVPTTDPEWSALALDQVVAPLALPAGLLPYDYHPKYGIAISNAAGVTKTTGYRLLRERFPEADFFMIGDADMDIIDDPSVVLCSVGNGSPRLKERAAFVAQGAVTQGFCECLSWILSL